MAGTKRKHPHSTHHRASGHHSMRVDQLGGNTRRRVPALDTFGMLTGPMARIMEHNWSMFHRTVLTMQDESLRFFNRRLEHASTIMENSRDVHGVSGLMQLQQEWIVDCARDYSEQATRFAQLMRDIAVNSTERLAEASSEVLERGANEIEDEAEEYEREGHRAAA